MNYLLDKEKELLKLNAELDERNKKLSGGESPQKKPGEVTLSDASTYNLPWQLPEAGYPWPSREGAAGPRAGQPA